MLRLLLDWFDQNRGPAHELALLPGARWYSEALLTSRFLPERRGDNRAESFTHADAVIGHFAIRPGARGEAVLLPNARQFVVAEAKLGSSLAAGVKNAAEYDQAARNVACMAQMVSGIGLDLRVLERFAFYVIAPRAQVDAGVFGNLVTKESIHRRVAMRVAQYSPSCDAWFNDTFEPVLTRIEVGILAWESLLESLPSTDAVGALREFYSRCLHFNPLRVPRTV